ncbi:O-antigen ligase [soil metagenome]
MTETSASRLQLDPLFADAETNAEGSAPAGDTPWLSGLMIAVLWLTPLVAYVGSKAFAPITGVAGLACAAVAVRRMRVTPILLALTALLAWALLSMIWSPVHPPAHWGRYKDLEDFTALKLVIQLPLYLAFVVAAGRVSASGARRALIGLGVGLLIVGVIVLIEGVRGQSFYLWLRQALGETFRPDLARRNVARAAYPMALLLGPSLLILSGRKLMAGALAIVTFVGALLLNVDAPLVAVVAGAAAWALVAFGGRFGPAALAVGVAGYFALAPIAVRLGALASHGHGPGIGKESWGARAQIWTFVSERVFQKPLAGWGLDASRVFLDDIPLHPHDAALQLWLELGAPGAAMAALIAVIAFGAVETLRRRDPQAAGAAAAAAAAYVVIGALSFGVWQEWWLALGALAVAVVRLVDVSRRPAATWPPQIS